MARTITVAILGDASSLERSFKRAGQASEGFGSKMRGVGKAAALGLGAAGLGAAVVGAQKAVVAASNLSEQMNKTGVVFGKNGADVVKWSENLTRSFGMSQRAALEAAGTYGNMLVPMGIAKNRAAQMSKKMVQLAGDMSSFNNASPEETLLAIRSGLAGETEPLRKFGVFLDQDRILGEALSSGLVKTTKNMTKVKVATLAVSKAVAKHTLAVKENGPKSNEAQEALLGIEIAQEKLQKALAGTKPKLTAQQKAMASYALIMKDTKNAQGDFANTSGSMANQQRILAAEFENVSAKVGQKLLPVVTKALALSLRFISWSEKNWPKFDKAIRDAIDRVRPIIATFQKAIEGIANVVQGVVQTIVAIKNGEWQKVWAGLKQVAIDGILEIVKAATALPRKIIGALSNSLVKALEEAINRMIGLANSAIGKFNAIPLAPDIPKIPTVGGNSASRARPSSGAPRSSGRKGRFDPQRAPAAVGAGGSQTVSLNVDGRELGNVIIGRTQRAGRETAASRRGPFAGQKLALG